MSSHKRRLNIPGGYLAFPHRTIQRALQLGLSGSQWRALFSCVYQYVGNETNYVKGSFQGGLSMFAKYGNMTRAEAYRALEFLVSKGLLVRVKSKDRRQAAEYRLNLDCCENETVANSQQSEEDTEQASGSQLRKSNSDGCENETVMLSASNSDGCESATQYRSSYSITGFKHFPANNTPPSPPESGELRSDEKAIAAGERNTSSNLSLCSSTLSGDFVPLPGAGTPPKLETQEGFLSELIKVWGSPISTDHLSRADKKYIDSLLEKSPKARLVILQEFATAKAIAEQNPGMLSASLDGTLEGFFYVLRNRKQVGNDTPPTPEQPQYSGPVIGYFEEELNVKANLTPSEIQEFEQLIAPCKLALFQSAFMKAVLDIKGQPVPEHLKRPGDRCMLLARYAAKTARKNGARL